MIENGGVLEQMKKYKNQILATMAVNVIALSHGHAVAWLAPTLPLLQSENSPLTTGPITVEEASWIGSLVCLGGLFGCSFFSILVNHIGRKKSLYLLTVPHACFWLLIIFGTEVPHLYIARTVSGITGGGIFAAVPTFVTDISDNKIRGTLGSMFMMSFNIGILSGFILGAYLSYSLFPQVIIGLSAFFIAAIFCLPDTPQYLIQMKRDDEAEKALKFYRNFKAATKEECREFNEHLANLKNRIRGIAEEKRPKLSYRDFLQPAAVRGLLAGIGLMFLNQFSGLFALICYTPSIFEMSGSNMDGNTCTIIVGAIQLLGTIVATNLVDRTGRRILLIVSCLGVALGSFALSVFSYLSVSQDLTHLSWLAVTSVSFAIFLGSIGLIPLPFVVFTEIMPHKVKAVSVSVCLIILNLLAFTVLKIYPMMMINFGMHGVMWISGGLTTIGAVLIFFFLPETKGKCLEVKDDDS